MKFLRSWKTRILLFFAVVGPGFITANVDNDANGIYTYSIAGAKFGHLLLWTLIPITVALIVVQEISARMGAVTGKGLSPTDHRLKRLTGIDLNYRVLSTPRPGQSRL